MAVTGQKRLGPFLGWRSVEEFCAREQERFVTRTQTQDLHRPNGRDRKVSFGCASVLAPEGNTGNTRTEVLRGDGDRAFIGGLEAARRRRQSRFRLQRLRWPSRGLLVLKVGSMVAGRIRHTVAFTLAHPKRSQREREAIPATWTLDVRLVGPPSRSDSQG